MFPFNINQISMISKVARNRSWPEIGPIALYTTVQLICSASTVILGVPASWTSEWLERSLNVDAFDTVSLVGPRTLPPSRRPCCSVSTPAAGTAKRRRVRRNPSRRGTADRRRARTRAASARRRACPAWRPPENRVTDGPAAVAALEDRRSGVVAADVTAAARRLTEAIHLRRPMTRRAPVLTTVRGPVADRWGRGRAGLEPYRSCRNHLYVNTQQKHRKYGKSVLLLSSAIKGFNWNVVW